MGFIFSQEAENRRIEARRSASLAGPVARWELYRTYSMAEAVHFARDNGWAENRVQVKAVRAHASEFEYYVEPYEEDCRCPNLLKYTDFFDQPDKSAP